MLAARSEYSGEKTPAYFFALAAGGGEGGEAHVGLDLGQREEIVLLQRQAEQAEALHEAHIARSGVLIVEDDV